MQHSYDLLLQPLAPGDALSLGPVTEALLARGARVSAEGHGTWALAAGELTLAPLLEAGVVKGLDVRVPYQDKTELLDETTKALLEVAEDIRLRVTDPQRGEALTLTTFSSTAEAYLRMARYAGEYGGVSAALGLSSYAAPPEEESSSFRWLLVLTVFALALYGGFRTLVMLRINADAQAEADEAPGQVDLPPKVPGK